MLSVKFGWNWPSVSREKAKHFKGLRTAWKTDRQLDAEQNRIRKVQLSFNLRWVTKIVKKKQNLHAIIIVLMHSLPKSILKKYINKL